MMVELIEVGENIKVMAMLLFGIERKGGKYAVYAVRRDEENVNIFLSKILKNSEGLILGHDFENGEKEAIEGVVQRLFSKVELSALVVDGFSLVKDIQLDGVISFAAERCYVTTVSKDFLKDFLLHYGLVTKRMLDRPVVEVVKSKKFFNEGFASSLGLIVFGILIVVVALMAIIQFFLR